MRHLYKVTESHQTSQRQLLHLILLPSVFLSHHEWVILCHPKFRIVPLIAKSVISIQCFGYVDGTQNGEKKLIHIVFCRQKGAKRHTNRVAASAETMTPLFKLGSVPSLSTWLNYARPRSGESNATGERKMRVCFDSYRHSSNPLLF